MPSASICGEAVARGSQIEVAVFSRAPGHGGPRESFRLFPNSGYHQAALRARALLQVVRSHVVPRALDEQSAAARATGVRAIAVNIALINVVQTDFASDLPGAVKRFRGRARLIAELEVGMKRGEVQRNVGPQMLQNPLRQLARLRGTVVQRGAHQVGDLEPDLRFVFQPLQGFEDWL